MAKTPDSAEIKPQKTGEAVWEYYYRELLLPGSHSFQFQRITSNGEESALTKGKNVRVVASFVKLGKSNISLFWLIILLLLAVLILVIYIVRLRIIIKKNAAPLGPKYKTATNFLVMKLLKRSLSEIRKDIEQVIHQAISRKIDISRVEKEIKAKFDKTLTEAEKEDKENND